MNKIRKNITAIEQKFFSLKAALKLHNQPISISQATEVITSGVITEQNAEDYLKYVHSSPQINTKEQINQKWYELEFPQMVTFLDKVTFYQNRGKIQEPSQKVNSIPSPQKRKIKAPTSEAHQNPYIPPKIVAPVKNPLQKGPSIGEKNSQSNKMNSQNSVNQHQQEGYYSILLLKKSKSSKEPETGSSETDSKVKQLLSDLPSDFQNLSPKERYSILSKKYGKDKSILEKKFDTIYKHYRKEMFIPFQSFQINNQLLMDLRIFLKYYREFQISGRFKTNQAIQHFKKIALNGLWLDDKNFIELHYKLVQLLQLDDTLPNDQSENTNDETNVQKANQMKLQISRKIKTLVDNIIKIKELSDVVSEDRVKQIFNNKEKTKVVKKIVEAHSGLTKDDVMLKLQQRIDLRKLRKNVLFGNMNQQKFQMSPNRRNTQNDKVLEDPTERLSPKKQSIYDELQIPKLRSRELKKSSVYSSLQQMNTQKEKEKLKLLVNERQNEQYLDAFFKKEKQLLILPRTKSVSLPKYPTDNEESTNGFTVNSTKSIKNMSKESLIFQRNLSLPRMKFN